MSKTELTESRCPWCIVCKRYISEPSDQRDALVKIAQRHMTNYPGHGIWLEAMDNPTRERQAATRK